MKNHFLILMGMLCFLSCERTELATSGSHLSIPFERTNSLPNHSSQNWDHTGTIFSELLQSTSHQDFENIPVDSFQVAIKQNIALHPYFSSLPDFETDWISWIEIQEIKNNPQAQMTLYLEQSDLPIATKAFFGGFLSELFVKIENRTQLEPILTFIVDFESQIMNDSDLTTAQKSFILITTSIARHGTYSKEKQPKKKDRKEDSDWDWDWMTTYIVGGMAGALVSEANAISAAYWVSKTVENFY